MLFLYLIILWVSTLSRVQRDWLNLTAWCLGPQQEYLKSLGPEQPEDGQTPLCVCLSVCLSVSIPMSFSTFSILLAWAASKHSNCNNTSTWKFSTLKDDVSKRKEWILLVSKKPELLVKVGLNEMHMLNPYHISWKGAVPNILWWSTVHCSNLLRLLRSREALWRARNFCWHLKRVWVWTKWSLE